VSTSLACAWYFRHRLRERTATLLFAGVAPVLGAAMLLWLLGVGPPLVVGVVVFAAGIALMLWWRTRSPATGRRPRARRTR
jgi:xanthine/uracil permease